MRMIKDKVSKWVEAGKILGADPNECVQCPECEYEYLEMINIPNTLNPIEFERCISCPKCKSRNFLRMKRS